MEGQPAAVNDVTLHVPLPSNEPGAKSVPEKRIAPFEEHAQTVSEACQIQNVQEEPEPPCGVPRDVNPVTEVADRFVATNGRQVALVSISEIASAFAPNRVEDVSRRDASALNRPLGHTGHWLSVRRHHREVADHENLRMMRDAQIRLDQYPAHSVDRHGTAKETSGG